ncbi:MAG: LacI family transcriptional regulator, partial [Rhodobacteraceae bacterium]|nr:LacI family transcriptional regulator [Paracoccaceae bacterium]
MKKLLAAAAALATVSTMAMAERYVMITHTQGTDP